MFIDQKWQPRSTDLNSIFIRQPEVEIFDPIPAPPKQHTRSEMSPRCVFLTPKEELNRETICEYGVVIQFELPRNVFPSFVGTSCSANYALAIFAEGETNDNHIALFPIRVSGPGSSEDHQYIRYVFIYLGVFV